MTNPILAVDKNAAVSLQEQAEWIKHGIEIVRVLSQNFLKLAIPMV